MNSVQMTQWQCHKKVWAEKIESITLERRPNGKVWLNFGRGSAEVTYEYMEKHKPQSGGYYVIYKDGCKSYSPAQAFESGYTRI